MQKIECLFLLWSLWYLAFISRIITAPILPLLETELAISHTMAGALYLFNSLGATIACILVGKLNFMFGSKKLIIGAFVLAAVASFGMLYAHGYLVIAALLFAIGFVGGTYLPSAIPILTSVFTQKQWGKAIAIHETAPGFCLLSVPIVVVYALKITEWRSLFLMYAICLIMATFLFWRRAPQIETSKSDAVSLRTILKRLDFWILFILWGNASMTSMGVYNILPLYLVDERAMEMNYANQLFGFSRVGGLIGIISIGFFLDRFSTKKIMLFLIVGAGLSTLFISLVDSSWLFNILLVLQGTFGVVFFPVGIMAISRVVPMHERSVYTGMFMAVSQVVGVGATPFALGAIADTWSFQMGFIGLGVFTLCLCPLVSLLTEVG